MLLVGGKGVTRDGEVVDTTRSCERRKVIPGEARLQSTNYGPTMESDIYCTKVSVH
jgi:hypothetical protein